MAELSDYKRYVEGPERIRRDAQEAALCDEIDCLRAALIQIRSFATVSCNANWRDMILHIKRQCDVLERK